MWAMDGVAAGVLAVKLALVYLHGFYEICVELAQKSGATRS